MALGRYNEDGDWVDAMGVGSIQTAVFDDDQIDLRAAFSGVGRGDILDVEVGAYLKVANNKFGFCVDNTWGYQEQSGLIDGDNAPTTPTPQSAAIYQTPNKVGEVKHVFDVFAGTHTGEVVCALTMRFVFQPYGHCHYIMNYDPSDAGSHPRNFRGVFNSSSSGQELPNIRLVTSLSADIRTVARMTRA